MTLKSHHKIIVNHEHNLNKIRSIVKSKNPEVLVLESEKEALNLKTNSIAYKFVTDENWIGIETRRIKRKRDNRLLKITLIGNQFIDKYRMRHTDAKVS